MKTRGVIVWFVGISLSISLRSFGLTYYVDKDATGTGDGLTWENACTTISAAVALVTPPGEVWVKGATYEEEIVMRQFVDLYGGFNGTETLREERDWNANATIIDASGSTGPTITGADDTVVDGFTITGASGFGIYCDDTSPTFRNCLIKGNGCGMASVNHGSPDFTNCVFANNRSSLEGSAIYAGFGSSSSFVNCTIVGHRRRKGGGAVYLYQSSHPSFTNCILWNRGQEFTVYFGQAPTVTYSCVQGGWPGTGNVDAFPGFVDEENGDYRLVDGSPCVDSGNVAAAPSADIEGNPRPGGDGAVDMGAYESPDGYLGGPGANVPKSIHVRHDAAPGGDGTSWGEAVSTIEEGLHASSTGDELWIAGGTYPEYVLMERNVALYGGFDGTEVLREERDRETNVTTIDASGFNASAVSGSGGSRLDGFTVTGGASARGGGGVHCDQADMVIDHCAIVWNAYTGLSGLSSLDGGGILCIHCSPTISNCLIAYNTSTDYGGGMYMEYSDAEVLHCIILGNEAQTCGGGISLNIDSSPFISNCAIIANVAEFGGGVFIGCGYCPGFLEAALRNCVMAWNRASGVGGGYYGYIDDYSSIVNCIAWDNLPDEIVVAGYTAVSSCDVKGGHPGQGNIDSYPWFVRPWDGTTFDLHLRVYSPCIDAGNAGAQYNDACRPPGMETVRNDMGVYGGPLNCEGLPALPPPSTGVTGWETYR